MSGYDAYCEYISLKNHFTTDSYDYIKYCGKNRLKVSSFEKRKDKIFFEKLAKHEDIHNFLLANFLVNEKAWVRDLAYSQEADKVYKDWTKRQQSLTYIFKQDLDKLEPVLYNNFKCSPNQHPLLLQKYLSKEISLETMCILLNMTGMLKTWDRELEFDLVWDMMRMKVKKYIPFIKYDKEKYKQVVVDKFKKNT